MHCPLVSRQTLITFPISVAQELLVVLFPCRVSIKILSLSQSQVFAGIGVGDERASISRRCFSHFHLHHARSPVRTPVPRVVIVGRSLAEQQQHKSCCTRCVTLCVVGQVSRRVVKRKRNFHGIATVCRRKRRFSNVGINSSGKIAQHQKWWPVKTPQQCRL